MTEDLRIDTGLVQEAGGRLQSLAAAIPPPPPAFSPAGADALSTAIAAKVAEVVDPVIAQLPVTKKELTGYASNVMNAANTYDAVDRQLAEEILKQVEQFDEATGQGTVGPGGGAAGTGTAATSAATGAASSSTGAASPAAGAASQAGQMTQMGQMPMQMAQQAAQAPVQRAGMAGAIPQSMQQAVQQVSELAGKDETSAETQ